MNRSTNDKVAALYPDHLRTVIERHDRALAEHHYDRIVIAGGALRMAFLDDNAYPFRVNPHFKYWAPIFDNPHCYLVYEPGSRPKIIFFKPVDFWLKPPDDPSGYWVEHFDIQMIGTPEDARRHVEGNGRSAFIAEPDETFAGWDAGDLNPQPLLESLHFDRTIKTDYEIECVREANRISVKGHRVAERLFREGASEFEIHIEYLRETAHNEAELPYGNIVGCNENASVLHYQHQNRDRMPVWSFLLDAGAQFNGYASDITRTYSREHDEFERMVAAVDRFQQKLCEGVRPGVDYRDLHLDAHRHVGDVLAEFGLSRVGGNDALERGITRAFFPHGLGHLLGLQVHDVSGFAADRTGRKIEKPEGHDFLRLTRIIEERQVFTIEPGIYFINSLLDDLRGTAAATDVNWDRVDTFRKYGGIRVEDDVVVTASGHENMTRQAFGSNEQ